MLTNTRRTKKKIAGNESDLNGWMSMIRITVA